MSFLAEILVHTSFFAAFLTGFYFIFVTYIQQQSLVNDLYNAFEPNIINSVVWSDPSKIQLALGQLNEVIEKAETSKGFTQAEAEIQSTNNYITKIVSFIMGVGCPLLFITGLVIEYYTGGNIYDLLVSNFIVIGFIALSEFFIVGVFLKNFIEIDANFITAVPIAKNSYKSGTCRYVYEFLESVLPDSFVRKFYG